MDKQLMDKQQKYEELLPRITALIQGEHDETAVMANVAAALADEFNWWWTGFYRVLGNELILGPFQGPVACYHIGMGRGVCGTAWQQERTIVVDDVEQFPGHIACSSASRSEIVVPVKDDSGKVRAVLDIDSRELAAFDAIDREWLERVVDIVAANIYI
jgi:GAF domain-containing protein